MRKQIKLPNFDFDKVGSDLGQAAKTAGKFIRNHKTEFLTGAFLFAVTDNIRVRVGRKSDQKSFKKSAINQQKVLRKHEAEISVLRAEAEQAHDAEQKVDQLAQIVRNMSEGGATE